MCWRVIAVVFAKAGDERFKIMRTYCLAELFEEVGCVHVFIPEY
jgi:hypothetical protein